MKWRYREEMRGLEKEIKRVRERDFFSGSHIPLFESLIIFSASGGNLSESINTKKTHNLCYPEHLEPD